MRRNRGREGGAESPGPHSHPGVRGSLRRLWTASTGRWPQRWGSQGVVALAPQGWGPALGVGARGVTSPPARPLSREGRGRRAGGPGEGEGWRGPAPSGAPPARTASARPAVRRPSSPQARRLLRPRLRVRLARALQRRRSLWRAAASCTSDACDG